MTQTEIEIALNAAFQECEAGLCPLNAEQKRILIQAMRNLVQTSPDDSAEINSGEPNPLADLTPEECQALLKFVRQEESQERAWKMTLLNDWIEGKDSGSVQFIRDRHGVQWLDRVKPFHLAEYDGFDQNAILRLKVGDLIEVTNGLWEWVQDDGPCSREWFRCTVVSIHEPGSNDAFGSLSPKEAQQGDRNTSCVVRFDTGSEYEIQGIYDWNRPNWRWVSS